MHVLIAFDKFKDCLTAREACAIVAAALREKHPAWTLDPCPLTDGGEGFCEILTTAASGLLEKFTVTGPRGAPVEAPIGFVPLEKIPPAARRLLAIENFDDRIAVIEMASASGLALLPEVFRDPWQTTSLGTGQLIRLAAERGASAILLGVGGSATHDLGLGALHALGLEFLSANGASLPPPTPAQWPQISRLTGKFSPALPPIRIACDVTNPLLGPCGAATVYGPQKGLRPADLPRLEQATSRLARLLATHGGCPDSLLKIPGTGAAGGIAFGLMAAARAEIVAGFSLVSAWLDLEARFARADLIITGEGRFDASSLSGKAPGAIAARAAALGKPAHVFAGSIALPSPRECHLLGDTPLSARGLFSHEITAPGAPLADALRDAPANLAAAVRAAF